MSTYESEAQVVERLKGDLMQKVPEAYKVLCEETVGASTGLEYYGMFLLALENALDSGLIPNKYATAVREAAAAIGRMYSA